MNMYNKLPHFVKLKNEKYFINTDFRIFIKFEEEIIRDKKSRENVYNCLNDFYPDFILIQQKGLIKEAVDKFIWFYKCGKKEIESNSKGNGAKSSIFSYEYDDQYIWGAFYKQYHIDLTTAYIHWWKFKAMWLSLESECEFCKIKGYRSYSGNDKDLLQLKQQYKLPLNENESEEKERRNRIFEELKNIKTSH